MTKGLDNKERLRVEGTVKDILGADTSGHAFDHVARVHGMSAEFAAFYPEVDLQMVELIALLHDVDDYKIVGREAEKAQRNTRRILEILPLKANQCEVIAQEIGRIGYSKALRGNRPQTLEGQIVSDADMCDAIGATGFVRAITYAVSDKGSGVIFDSEVYPNVTMGADEYNAHGTTHDNDSFVNHIFEKLFKLREMMLTEPGAREAAERDEIMIEFLKHYFEEYRQAKWVSFLENYLVERQADKPL